MKSFEEADRATKAFAETIIAIEGKSTPSYKLAARISQNGVINTEQAQLAMGVDYTDNHVRIATVHTRQDIVLIVSLLETIAGNSTSIRKSVARMAALISGVVVAGLVALAALIIR